MINLTNHVKLKVLLSIFIVWGIVHLISYPLSYSKFIVEEDEFLKYNSNMVSLEQESSGTMRLLSSTETTAILEFDLEKNKNDIADVKTDVYQLILPDWCLTNEQEITFESDESKTIQLTCDTTRDGILKQDENGRKYLDVYVKVNEIVNDELPFRYKEYHYYEEYQAPLIVNDEQVESENKFDVEVFKTILYSYLSTREEYQIYREEINCYIESATVTENSFELLGITVDYQQEYNQYTYQEDENFLGYARTYYENINNKNEGMMIFSSNDEEKLEQAFFHYLKTYYQFSSDQFALITNYMKSKGNIGCLIKNKTQIDGLIFLDNYSIYLDNKMMKFAENYVGETQVSIYHDCFENMKNAFMASVNLFNISIDVKEKIKLREDVINCVTSTFDIPVEDQYFLIQGENVNILVEVSFEGSCNTIQLFFLSIDNKEEELVFRIENPSGGVLEDECINTMIYFLEGEFDGVSIRESLIKEEGDIFAITFRMQKNKLEEDNNIQNEDEGLIENENQNIDLNSTQTIQANQETIDDSINQSSIEINEIPFSESE